MDESRFGDSVPHHAPQDAPVRESCVLHRVVGQGPIQHEGDGSLDPNRNVVHDAPRDELRDEPRHHSRVQDAQQDAGEQDGYRRCPAFGGREIRGERREDLRDACDDAEDEGDYFERDEVGREREAKRQCCCDGAEKQDEWSPEDQITQGRDEKKTCCVASMIMIEL